MTILGIDIGGSGIKAAPVDITTGALLAERYRLDTPQPSKPKAVAKVVAELTRHFDWHGPIGATMPARIKNGVAHTAANIDKKWIGTNVAQLFAQTTGCPTRVLNDADAAGVAEMAFGAGRGRMGLVLMLTFGTGIGSGLFIDGILVPNTELGHLIFHGDKAEAYAADSARKRDGLSWEKWAERLQQYLDHIEFILTPDLIILGGGISRPQKHQKFLHLIKTQADLVPAQLQNEAGIIGAASAARVLVDSEHGE
ncbi:MAG: ROK family protein [Bacteroidetes bacterium]|nr:ROK family protein [Bacteroidota bacterium]